MPSYKPKQTPGEFHLVSAKAALARCIDCLHIKRGGTCGKKPRTHDIQVGQAKFKTVIEYTDIRDIAICPIGAELPKVD